MAETDVVVGVGGALGVTVVAGSGSLVDPVDATVVAGDASLVDGAVPLEHAEATRLSATAARAIVCFTDLLLSREEPAGRGLRPSSESSSTTTWRGDLACPLSGLHSCGTAPDSNRASLFTRSSGIESPEQAKE